MINSFFRLFIKLTKVAISLCLALYILIMPIGSSVEAAKTSMTGDYMKDTVSVAEKLRDTINIEQDDEKRPDADKEAVLVITDYISRYRNRSQVNGSLSFTTMQTALNSLAGHYKTFPNRPVPETLKNRLNEELSKAEELVENQK
tara:strand:- start:21 stop:455 length:435 start_codon:yes stop_codon:yes gene_type:complete